MIRTMKVNVVLNVKCSSLNLTLLRSKNLSTRTVALGYPRPRMIKYRLLMSSKKNTMETINVKILPFPNKKSMTSSF